MKRILNVIALVFVFLLNDGCRNEDDGIVFPAKPVNLTFPTNSLLCIDNTITFDWDDVENSQNNTISYTIIIAKDRALTAVVENRTTVLSEITLTLDKAVAYYWKVTKTNTTNNEITDSEIFPFYTKGEGIVNYIPFASELVSPTEDSQLNAGAVNLSWIGSDTDSEDTLTYELYFSENSPPTVIEDSLIIQSYTVSVETGKTYYWKVNVIDQNGAKSIGQIWNFTVN
jgi:hypothetical protein